jgi:radical SAM superfamily enzyme
MKTFIREIVGRCPDDDLPISKSKCEYCTDRGRTWETKLKKKDYRFVVECEFNKKKLGGKV